MRPSDVSPSEYNVYYGKYIQNTPDLEITEALKKTSEEVITLFSNLSEAQQNFRYAEGKWTPKEILQHIMDTERIFAYRALRIARQDATPMPGYEQDDYVLPSKANLRSIDKMLDEYKSIRQASVSLFQSFDDEMWQQMGVASGSQMSARAAASLLPGHERHHLNVIRERYL